MKNQIELALWIMEDGHAGQIRKFGADAGQPYTVHTRRVGDALPDRLKPAGYLHDILEDTDWTASELLAQGVEQHTIEIVKALTKRAGENYFDRIVRISKFYDAAMVKVQDLEDNLKDAPNGSLADKYRFARFMLKAILGGHFQMG